MNRAAIAGFALYTAHVIAVLWHFPPKYANPADPLATGDLPITLGKAWDIASSGRFIGYSPSYMAGYPLGTWNSVGHRGYELATVYLPFGSPPTNYWYCIVGMAALSPLLLALAGWAGGCRFATALGCLGGASIVVQLCDPTSFFWTFGNSGFVFGSSLGVLATGLALPTDGRILLRRALASGLVAGAAVVVHTVAAVPVAFGGVAAAIVVRRVGISWGHLATAMAVAVVSAVAFAVPAYSDLLVHPGNRAAMPIHPLPSGIRYLVMDLLNDRGYHAPMDRRSIFHVLLVLASWAGWKDRRMQSGPAPGLALAGGAVLLFGYASGHVPGLMELQPYRFVVCGELFLVVPACLGLGRLVVAIREANPAGRAAVIAVALMFLPGLTGYVWDLAARSRARGLDTDSLACADWFRSAPDGGRVLCEPVELGCLFPHLTGRPVIGGNVGGQAVVNQNWAHADAGRAFGRPLADVPPDEFVRLLRALDVHYLVTETPAFDQYIRGLPAEVAREQSFGRLVVYRLVPANSRDVWEGVLAGKVTAKFNHIRVVDPPVGRFVLPYHFIDGLRADAGVTVEPAAIPGAAAPFIAVTVPERRATVDIVFQP